MSEQKVGFFSDLDQTLIYSSKNVELTLSKVNFNGLVVVETNKEHPASYMTLQAILNLAKISHLSHFIPTTTRINDQYRRISFPNANIEYAITTNGAVILHNGEPDKGWTNTIKKQLEGSIEPVDKVFEFWSNLTKDTLWVKNLNKANGFFIYFVVDRNEMPYHFLEELENKAEEWNYKLSIQGRKIYFIPKFLTKGYAVQEVSERLGIDYIISAGDSNLDKTMLTIADYALRPAHGGLHEDDFTAENLIVTDNYGINAGEEILSKVLHRILN